MSNAGGAPTNGQRVAEYREELTTALKRFHDRTHWEPATEQTPLDALLESEEGQLDEWAVKRETAIRILEWLALDGAEPAAVMKRVYALGSHMLVEPFCLLTLRERGLMLGDSHGAELWRTQRLCVDPLRRKGAKSYKGAGQKSLEASAAAAVAQTGNSNRKKKANGHVAAGGKFSNHAKNKQRKG